MEKNLGVIDRPPKILVVFQETVADIKASRTMASSRVGVSVQLVHSTRTNELGPVNDYEEASSLGGGRPRGERKCTQCRSFFALQAVVSARLPHDQEDGSFIRGRRGASASDC